MGVVSITQTPDSHSLSAQLSMRLYMKQPLKNQQSSDANENQESHPPTRLLVDLGKEVGGGNVKGHSARKWQGVFELTLKLAGKEDAGEGCGSHQARGTKGVLLALAAGENNAGDGEAFRKLVEKDGKEDHCA